MSYTYVYFNTEREFVVNSAFFLKDKSALPYLSVFISHFLFELHLLLSTNINTIFLCPLLVGMCSRNLTIKLNYITKCLHHKRVISFIVIKVNIHHPFTKITLKSLISMLGKYMVGSVSAYREIIF